MAESIMMIASYIMTVLGIYFIVSNSGEILKRFVRKENFYLRYLEKVLKQCAASCIFTAIIAFFCEHSTNTTAYERLMLVQLAIAFILFFIILPMVIYVAYRSRENKKYWS